jgi:FimV-like protein
VDDLFKEEPAESSTETLPTPPGSRERESFLVHEQPATDDTASVDTGTFRGTTTGSGLEAAAALLDEEEQALDRVPSIQESEEGQEESDPMAEADFHMAYGLYDQAADILRSALDRAPSNRELQMKLAEVYFVWGNQDEFKSMAEKLSADRSDSDWDKILIMGKQLLPDDPLFSEMPGGGGRGGVDLALEATQVGGIVDMELGSGSFDRPTGASAVDLDLGDALDFAGDTQETPAVEGEDGTQPGLEALDFDLGGESGQSPLDLARTVETPRAEEFDIGSDYGEESSPTPTERTAEIDLDDLGLDVNLDDSFIGRAPGGASEDSDATGVRAAPDFGRDQYDDTSATGMHAAGIIGDDDETMLARFDDGDAGSTAILERRGSGDAESEHVDFDIGGDFESTDAGTDLTRELTDTETLSAGDVPGGLRDTVEMTGIHRAGELEATAEVPALPDEDLDLDLGNLSDVLDEGETREMREGLGDTMEVLGVGEVEDEELDLDIGESYEDESGGTNTMEMTDMTMPEAEALTLSEIGTKLDLARAYMDMGDPDGARSILQEVMEEGDNAQQADAKRLLDTLP